MNIQLVKDFLATLEFACQYNLCKNGDYLFSIDEKIKYLKNLIVQDDLKKEFKQLINQRESVKNNLVITLIKLANCQLDKVKEIKTQKIKITPDWCEIVEIDLLTSSDCVFRIINNGGEIDTFNIYDLNEDDLINLINYFID